ncbi:MAG: hypothetical protein UT34_C0002G0199 [candidate division WS6 bacterium GW2011_GWF2_39_15]|uniref:Uncharacterized protein n=1 Tax=candidate division WS6 bacterium GW2011_GWF2_39_15 TaxID=1619100 RepID=A0A0G0QVQ2_9BACT|nr:MAG: hypothetical protein UT34_C0002G0199 [candidate division WS6 bacterium GW2011_GWF2_39_15]
MKRLIWKTFLTVVFLLVGIHFVKDITQDILSLDTFLNKFGDINENITKFPEWLVWFYHWAMVNTFFGEILILLCIPKSYMRKKFEWKREEKIIVGTLLYIVVMFTVAYFLS